MVDFDDASPLRFGWNWSMRGVYRYGPTPGVILTVEFAGPPTDRTSAVTASEIQESLQRVSGTDVRITQLHGQGTRWTDNARQASTYRLGRVLLAGDAHVHSPFSGQGLNLGLGDATNLGWKLAATVAGRAPESLLDTYNVERHPVGERVLDWTRAQIALMRPNSKVGQLRSAVADLMGTRDGMTQIVNKISGVTQRVELPDKHPLTGRLVPDITLADERPLRAAFADGRFVLLDGSSTAVFRTIESRLSGVDGDLRTALVLSAAQPPCSTFNAFENRCNTVFLAAAAPWRQRIALLGGAFRAPTHDLLAMLVRPDGVIAWAAAPGEPADLDGLTTALKRWAGQPAFDQKEA